ncbi:MAG TPA: universal stress protein [Cyclobacteriaceae bacterium]|jgi:nucleotide-binding universal stress UspA family protein
MKRMRFLVPVDFSEGAANAVRYAAALAETTSSSVVVLHVVVPPFDDHAFLAFDADAVRDEAQAKLDAWAAEQCGDYDIEIECKVRVGEVADETRQLADLLNIDFIIMGTHSVTAMRKLLYGSHTTEVIERVACPVLAIPEHTPFVPYQKIVYATDYQTSDLHALAKLSQLAELTGAAIDVVHISEEGADRATELSVISYFEDLIRENIPYPNISCRVFHHENVGKGIERFTHSVGGDIVALAMRRQGFLSKLFRGSLTEEFVTRSTVPIIAFHVHQPAEAEER